MRYIIIIPHHESVDTLTRCLNSIPVRDDIEIMVIADPSPTHTLFLRYRFVEVWSKCYRRSAIESAQSRFLPFMAANDLHFTAHLLSKIRHFEVSADEIYCLSNEPGSITHTFTSDLVRDRIVSFSEYFTYLKHDLSPGDFQKLRLNGRRFIRMAIWNVRSFKLFLFVIEQLWIHRIPIFTKKTPD